MAADWIKMRTDLYRDPKVCVVATLLMVSGDMGDNSNVTRNVTRNIVRNAVVGALVTVWGMARHSGKRDGVDLVIRGCGAVVIDAIADLPGMGAAMVSVGWIEERDGGLVFPRFFEEFNVDPAGEYRSKNAERQRRYREKKAAERAANGDEKRDVTRDVTVTSHSNVREEKRRVSKDTPIPPSSPGAGGVPTTPPEAKPKRTRRDPTAAETDPRFLRFWAAYPRHEKRSDTAAVFARLNPGAELMEEIIAAIERQKRKGCLEPRTADGRDVRPHPTTWLNGRRWQDEHHTRPPTVPFVPVIKRAADNPFVIPIRGASNAVAE